MTNTRLSMRLDLTSGDRIGPGKIALLEAIRSTVPLSTTRAEEIEALREWAEKRAVPASTPEARAVRA